MNDVTDAADEQTTLIAELLEPIALKATLGVSLRELARRVGCDEGSLRRLKRREGVSNETAYKLSVHLRIDGLTLFRARTPEDAATALDKLIERRTGTRRT